MITDQQAASSLPEWPDLLDGCSYTVGQCLSYGLLRSPNRIALIDADGWLTYRQLDRAVSGWEAQLSRQGVAPGVVVAASIPNNRKLIAAFIASMRLGAVWVGVNRAAAGAEITHILGDSRAELLLVDTQDEAHRRAELDGLEAIRILNVDELARPGEIHESAFEGQTTGIEPFVTAAISYTSGTSGLPKGVQHSQYNIALAAAVLGRTQSLGPHVKGVALPATILNVLITGVLETFAVAGTVVLIDHLSAQAVAEWVERWRIERLLLPTPVIMDLIDGPLSVAEKLASLHDMHVGGGPCADEIYDAYMHRFGRALSGGYGLSEAPTGVARENQWDLHRPGAAGRGLPHIAITIRDEGGAVLPPNSSGEICVEPVANGPWAHLYRPMLGYWANAAATADTLRHGVLHTGDIGSLDDDGYLTVHARRTDLIIRGGANVYPAEVERVLDTHPGVAASKVLGRTHRRLGQEVVAFVEPSDGSHSLLPTELIKYCEGKLARYKVPVEVHIIPHLPRSAMGKIQRSVLADLLADERQDKEQDA